MEVSINGAPQKRPQYVMILILEPPTKGPHFWETTHYPFSLMMIDMVSNTRLSYIRGIY